MTTFNNQSADKLLRRLFQQAVACAQPAQIIKDHLPESPTGRTIVVGAGKATAAMARAFEDCWSTPLSGLVVTAYGHAVDCQHIEVIEAAHPIPDAASEQAARRILQCVAGLNADDLVVGLFSGGGSALLALADERVGLALKQRVNEALLKSGARIGEMNCVRKHLSAIKGGRLALAAAPAQIHSLLISDVPGDDPAVIASGPTLADPTSCADALAVLQKYAIDLPQDITALLDSGAIESPFADELALQQGQHKIIAKPQQALESAAKLAEEMGFNTMIISDSIDGDANQVAQQHGDLVRQIYQTGKPLKRPAIIFSGGETSVTVRGKGKGGRNGQFALALAVALQGQAGVYAIAADTDGIDGNGDNAGCMVTPDSLARGSLVGLDAAKELDNNNAYGFFSALDDLVITGPTLTNVNDFRAILIT